MYQPALLDRQIQALYLIKTQDGRPMTFHARTAVDEYLARYPEILEQVTARSSSTLGEPGFQKL